MKRNYYKYQGFSDGSGHPDGYVIKSYTEDEAKRLEGYGYKLTKIESSYDNTDYLHDDYKFYNHKYIKRSPIAKEGEGDCLLTVGICPDFINNELTVIVYEKTRKYLLDKLLSQLNGYCSKTIIMNPENIVE